MARRHVRRFHARAAPGRADHLPRHVWLGSIPVPVPTGPRSLAHVAEHARMACGRPDPDPGRCFVAGLTGGRRGHVGPVARGGRPASLASPFAAGAGGFPRSLWGCRPFLPPPARAFRGALPPPAAALPPPQRRPRPGRPADGPPAPAVARTAVRGLLERKRYRPD